MWDVCPQAKEKSDGQMGKGVICAKRQSCLCVPRECLLKCVRGRGTVPYVCLGHGQMCRGPSVWEGGISLPRVWPQCGASGRCAIERVCVCVCVFARPARARVCALLH